MKLLQFYFQVSGSPHLYHKSIFNKNGNVRWSTKNSIMILMLWTHLNSKSATVNYHRHFFFSHSLQVNLQTAKYIHCSSWEFRLMQWIQKRIFFTIKLKKINEYNINLLKFERFLNIVWTWTFFSGGFFLSIFSCKLSMSIVSKNRHTACEHRNRTNGSHFVSFSISIFMLVILNFFANFQLIEAICYWIPFFLIDFRSLLRFQYNSDASTFHHFLRER